MSKFRRQLMTASMSEPVPPTPVLPYDAEVEWLGIRQATYITTDYVPTGNDIVIETKIGFIGYPTTSNYAVWFAARSGATYRNYRILRSTDNNKILVGNYNTDSNATAITRTVENSVCTIKSEWGKITINGTEYALDTTNAGSENAAPFTIGDIGLSRGVNENIYYFKVYKGDVLKLDLIPVRVGQTGYLYDRVSRQLFGNGGTGNLVLGRDVITNEKLQRLRELGCLMWFPLNETSGLNDVIGEKSITPLYADAFTFTTSTDSHIVKLQKDKTVIATISTGFEQSQFTDGGWTTIAQAKRYSTTDTSGNANIYHVADSAICICFNLSRTGETKNWDNNVQTTVLVCDGNGRKIYTNGTKIVDDSYVYDAPWSDAKINVNDSGNHSQPRYVYVANDLLFDHKLTEQEIAEAMEILGITW